MKLFITVPGNEQTSLVNMYEKQGKCKQLHTSRRTLFQKERVGFCSIASCLQTFKHQHVVLPLKRVLQHTVYVCNSCGKLHILWFSSPSPPLPSFLWLFSVVLLILFHVHTQPVPVSSDWSAIWSTGSTKSCRLWSLSTSTYVCTCMYLMYAYPVSRNHKESFNKYICMYVSMYVCLSCQYKS